MLELGLTLQLDNIEIGEIDSWELIYRSLLFKEVVGKDWVKKEVIERFNYDASLLGVTQYQLLSRWLKGIYINNELGSITTLDSAIDWLIHGDRVHLCNIDRNIINEAELLTTNICREYLETAFLELLESSEEN